MQVFTSKEDVALWLAGKPRDVVGCIAMRASLRAVPALKRMRGLARTSSARHKVLRIFRNLAANWATAAFLGDRNALMAAALSSLSGSVTSDVQRASEYVTATAASVTEAEAVDYARRSFSCAIEAVGLDGKGPFEDFLRACANDAEILDQRTSSVVLAMSQLWPGSMPPKWCLDDTEELEKTLLAAGEGWDVWTNWYEDRLRGNTPNQSLELARATIPDEFWESPAIANEYISRLIAEPQTSSSISTDSNLESQIFELSHNEALVVGLRASLRSIPLFSLENIADQEIASEFLALLRAVSSAWGAAVFPNLLPHRIRSQIELDELSKILLLARAAGDANRYSAFNEQSGSTAEIVTRAITDLRSYADDADGRAAGVIVGMSLSDDMNDLRGATPMQVVQLPLWSGGQAPNWSSQRWDDLKRKLISLGVGWEVWVNWYEDRIAGVRRTEEQEFAYVDVPGQMWADGPARVNTWILNRIEQLQSQTAPIDALPNVPAQLPAAIEPIWRKGRLTLSKTSTRTDLKGRAFTAALKSLREELQTFANDVSEQTNIDKRFVAVVRRLSDQIPRKVPLQSEIFRLGHAETIFAGYANTVNAEWPPFLAAQYHALALHFERTMRQVPLWREFKRNATKGTLTPSQVQEATLLATELASTLRFDEVKGIVDAVIPQAVEQMAVSLQAALTANSDSGTIEAGAELLAYDVVESVNNILKSTFGAAAWAETTLKMAGAKFTAEARKSVVNEAGRLGKNVGPAITKWAKRTVKVGIGTGGSVYAGKPLILWLTSTYPEIFAWLLPITHLF